MINNFNTFCLRIGYSTVPPQTLLTPISLVLRPLQITLSSVHQSCMQNSADLLFPVS